MKFVFIHLFPKKKKINLSQHRDLNSRPPDYKSDALPLSYIGMCKIGEQLDTYTMVFEGVLEVLFEICQFLIFEF